MRVFKKRQFVEGKLVKIITNDPIDPHKIISKVLDFIRENEAWTIGGGSTCGRGMYIAFHTVEDANAIEKHIKKLMKEIKNGRS